MVMVREEWFYCFDGKIIMLMSIKWIIEAIFSNIKLIMETICKIYQTSFFGCLIDLFLYFTYSVGTLSKYCNTYKLIYI